MLSSLFINAAALLPYKFIKKKIPTLVFSCEHCEIFKDSFSDRTPLVTALVLWAIIILNFKHALKNLDTINDFNFTTDKYY